MERNKMTRVPVLPKEHDAECRRGQDGCSEHYGLDRERCSRCINLRRRLEDVAARRRLTKLGPNLLGQS
jgi:hypothetical protein